MAWQPRRTQSLTRKTATRKMYVLPFSYHLSSWFTICCCKCSKELTLRPLTRQPEAALSLNTLRTLQWNAHEENGRGGCVLGWTYQQIMWLCYPWCTALEILPGQYQKHLVHRSQLEKCPTFWHILRIVSFSRKATIHPTGLALLDFQWERNIKQISSHIAYRWEKSHMHPKWKKGEKLRYIPASYFHQDIWFQHTTYYEYTFLWLHDWHLMNGSTRDVKCRKKTVKQISWACWRNSLRIF